MLLKELKSMKLSNITSDAIFVLTVAFILIIIGLFNGFTYSLVLPSLWLIIVGLITWSETDTLF